MILKFIFLLFFVGLLFFYVVIRKNMHYWLPYYLLSKIVVRSRSAGPLHIMFCFVDHFEPANGGVDPEAQEKRVDAWMNAYPRMADKHCDADGVCPQHTWFYPPHLDHVHIQRIHKLCLDGYGEIEMHLHHNHMDPFPETSESLKQKIQQCIVDYSQFGIFCLPDNKKKYAFIHGDWSLANSRGENYCGVNNELSILSETGCYADFTFPCLTEAQPKKVNSIYYADDNSNPDQPKSYDTGNEVVVNGAKNQGLMIIQGIIGLRWNLKLKKLLPSIEASNIDDTDLPTTDRVDYWVKNGISIKGKPEWMFIKLHTHGAPENHHDALLGSSADSMYTYFETTYNDGNEYILHYVTAREMYNIIKAAEAGETGNPNDFRDYEIPKYLNRF